VKNGNVDGGQDFTGAGRDGLSEGEYLSEVEEEILYNTGGKNSEKRLSFLWERFQ